MFAKLFAHLGRRMGALSRHLSYANVMSTLAVVLVLGGGVAYAANTVFSSDIVNNQVRSEDVRNDDLAGGGLSARDLRAGAVRTSEVLDDSLTRFDIANVPEGSDDVNANLLDGMHGSQFVQVDGAFGRASLLSNRVVLVPGNPDKPLVAIPRLGDLFARCLDDHADILWRNSTLTTIDRWQEVSGTWSANLIPPTGLAVVAHSDLRAGGTLALGLGNDPGPRRIAVVHGFAFQSQDGAPCGLQVLVTLWAIGD